MKPLNVTLIHRDRDGYRKLCGWWSYPVPEFTWTPVKVGNVGFHAAPKPGADLIALEDWIFGNVAKQGIPMAYWVIDSGRSSAQLERNRRQAMQADLILVDSDRLENFSGMGVPARRCAYAVNEQLYKPVEKDIDVAFLCWPTPERRAIQFAAERICKAHGWSFLTGTFDQLVYAEQLARAKIVVHFQHVKNSRSWRLFDVMATRGCILSSVIPLIDGDGIKPGVHYAEYRDEADLESRLIELMGGEWVHIAETGYNHVMKYHTWETRAAELRALLSQELGL